MKLEALPWLILFLPLLAAGIITLFTLADKKVSATLSITAIATGFALTLAFILANGFSGGETAVNWLSIGSLSVGSGPPHSRVHPFLPSQREKRCEVPATTAPV